MRETKMLELKEIVNNSFLKTVSAYANYGTGQVIFGIADDGNLVGVDNLEDTCLAIENKINDSIQPSPDFTLSPNSKNRTVTLTVQEGLHKPYLYKAKAYKRNDTSTIEVDRVELTRLILEGENLTFDATDAHSKSLTFHTLSTHIEKEIGICDVNDDVLKTLELEDSSGKFNVAAELLADKNTFPGIDIARFGNNINIFKERLTFEKESVLLEYERTLEVYKRNYQYEEVIGTERVARDLIPEAAFRETIANALVHRQWDINAHVRVSMFEDKIEVVSPGGLVKGISESEYLTGQISMLRNPILGNVFFRLGIIERFGTGVLRIKECYGKSATQPQFFVNENSIKVVLPLFRSLVNLPEDEATVYRIIKGKEMAIGEISASANFGKSKTLSILKKLASKGYAEVVGKGRGTKYRA